MNTHPLLRRFSATCFIAAVLISTQGMAQWTVNTLVNTSTSTTVNERQHPTMIPDGAGGAIIVWEEQTGDTTAGVDIVAQRIDALGNMRWGELGVAVCSAAGDQLFPSVAVDGAGGAIITWYDGRGVDTDIYAQRVDADGSMLWTVNGVPLCLAPGNQWDPVITTDGSGGAIVAWYEARYDTAADIYAQRVNSAGVVQWTTNGVPVCTQSNGQVTPIIIGDGGGAVIVWLDFRNGDVELFAQRLTQGSSAVWTFNGMRVGDGSGYQYAPTMTGDGTGGAIITWHDFRSGAGSDIYGQRISGLGIREWSADGIAVSNAASYQYRPQITTDGASGAIVTWYDYRGGVNSDIYAQRLSPSGSFLWTPGGLLVCGAINDQQFPSIVKDGLGGAFIGWQDTRSGANPDIFAQRVNALGGFGFAANGIAVSTALNGQFFPRLVSNVSGGAIVVWEDRRTGFRFDVFAHRTVLNNPDAAFGYWMGGVAQEIEGMPAYSGLHPAALDGADGRDILEPTLPPSYVSVSLLPLTTERYIQDVRQEAAELAYKAKRYSIQSRTSTATSTVNLVFTEDRLPSRFTPVLYDIELGTYLDVRSNPVWSYTSSSTSGQPHDLLLLLGDSTNPSVSVTTPNGGEVLVVGYPYTIQWSASDSSGLLWHYLYYTLDSLLPYMLIDSTNGQNMSYAWTPSQASMNAFLRIVTVDSVLNMSSDTSDAYFTITAGDSVVYETFAGWNMIGVPTLQTDMSPQGVLGDDLGGGPISIFGFHPVSGYFTPDTLRLGAGYWLRTINPTVIDAVGSVQASVSRALVNGWNMIGNPFPAPYPKSMLRFTDGVTIKTLAEAQSAGWLMDVLYGFNGSSYVLENVSLAVWNGYWLRMLVPNITILYDLGSAQPASIKTIKIKSHEQSTRVQTKR
jgi:hypothetical protein